MSCIDDDWLIVLPDNKEVLFKKHNKVGLLENLLEKLDNFLILKQEKYDDLFNSVFIVHQRVLRLRAAFVDKLYCERDKIIWKRNNQEVIDFFQECIDDWPSFRVRQRRHFCFYLGEDNLLDDVLHPDKKNTWPMMYFKKDHYQKIEPKIVQDYTIEPSFKLTKHQEQLVYREANTFVVELDRLITQLMEDPFYKDHCFDPFFDQCRSVRIHLTELRQDCVEKYVGGEEAKILKDIFEGRINILWDTELFKKTRKDQR